MKRAAVLGIISVVALSGALPALAQVQNAGEIQRETALLANPAVPAGQRMLFDYGGYTTLGYTRIDDLNRDNHGLRQYDLFGYARLNLDDVHDFFVRGHLTWQDFNPGDSFDGRGDNFEARIDRAFYKFDLAKAM